MLWYGGSMVEAVNLSKQRNAIFVVFIEGDNELSTELASTIENQAVVSKLSNETNFLAVKLKSGSENYTHFAKIYQFVPVPSLFFIGRNGTPLEVVCAGVEPQNLADRIDRILDEHYKEKCVQPSTSGQNIRNQITNFLQAETTFNPPASSATLQPEQPKQAPIPTETQPSEVETTADAPNINEVVKTIEVAETVEVEKHAEASKPETAEPPAKVARTEHREVTASGREYDVVCDGDVCVRRPCGPKDPGPSQREDSANAVQPETMKGESSSTASMEERLEHAKELIEARRREKAEKELELEKEKEKERRATGQGVAELKRWQADQEMKMMQEERRREKLENDLTRQRILQQIALDRAERRARDQPAPAAAPAAASAPAAAPATVPASADRAPTGGDVAARARVQFKLPDGAAHTAHFDAADTLATVRRYVADNLQLSSSAFALWTAFPRRELTESDATLRELQLAPSAALLVLPRRAPAAVAPPTPFSSFIAIISQLFASMILNPAYAAYAWLRGRVYPRAASPTSPAPPPPGPPAPRAPPAAGVRRRGNVHRLTGDRGADDENNTWNGNSTQQM